MPDRSPDRPPLISDFATDPEMRDLVMEFVAEMPGHVRELHEAWERHERDTLVRLAHQLKGCCASYGFEPIGDAAARLEAGLKQATATLEGLTREFQDLTDLCSRAAA
ncbi:MAG TPA: Hpt domain-containing protein [Phycisphaerales bacterium]|nr:Hpt domain-containing protein [Phycisphaerales bacterium]